MASLKWSLSPSDAVEYAALVEGVDGDGGMGALTEE
jgi:hypothetical protein